MIDKLDSLNIIKIEALQTEQSTSLRYWNVSFLSVDSGITLDRPSEMLCAVISSTFWNQDFFCTDAVYRHSLYKCDQEICLNKHFKQMRFQLFFYNLTVV